MKLEPGPYDWRYYLSWEGRIGPRAYMIGQQVIGVAGLFIALLLFGISMIWTGLANGGFTSSFFILLVAVLSIPGSSLLVRRAHDFGWPAAASLTAFLAPLGAVLALVVRIAYYGRESAQAEWLQLATSTPLVFAEFSVAGFLSLWLALKKGQPEANRYGAAPS